MLPVKKPGKKDDSRLSGTKQVTLKAMMCRWTNQLAPVPCGGSSSGLSCHFMYSPQIFHRSHLAYNGSAGSITTDSCRVIDYPQAHLTMTTLMPLQMKLACSTHVHDICQLCQSYSCLSMLVFPE